MSSKVVDLPVADFKKLAEGPKYERMTSTQLVAKLGEEVNNGHYTLAGDCCAEIICPRPEFTNPTTAFRASVETASLIVPGESEPRKVWAGIISLIDPREPSLDRFLSVQGQKTQGPSVPIDTMEICECNLILFSQISMSPEAASS